MKIFTNIELISLLYSPDCIVRIINKASEMGIGGPRRRTCLLPLCRLARDYFFSAAVNSTVFLVTYTLIQNNDPRCIGVESREF